MNTQSIKPQNIKQSDTKKSAVSKDAVYKKHSSMDVIFILFALVAAFACLWLVPFLLAKTGVSFLGQESGLSKLVSVIVSVLVGVVVVYPTALFKNTVVLVAGAKLEWKKSTKPPKDQVYKTTGLVLAIVFIVSIFLYIFDSILFWIFKSLLS